MSYSYGYLLQLDAARWPRLRERLAAILEADALACLPRDPDVSAASSVGEVEPCVQWLWTLRLPADAALEEFARRHPDIGRDAQGRIRLGYVDAQLQRGDAGLVLYLHSTARDVAEALRDSTALREYLSQLAMTVPLQGLEWLDEWGDGGRLWPRDRAEMG